METRSIGNFREPYVRGPHVRYFITAMAIALFIVIALFAGAVLLI